MIANGMMIGGRLVPVAGVRILPPNAESWNFLARGQLRAGLMGATYRPQLKIIHKTIADDREHVIEGAGPAARWGGARDTLEFWQTFINKKTGKHEPLSGTHLVTGHNGDTLNPEDVVTFIGWHAGSHDADANARSWGHEIKELHGGGVHRSALSAAVAITLVDTSELGVQWQYPRRYRANRPLKRFANGGRDLVGVFGHRDVTTDRGYHDPGDEVGGMLESVGFELYDFGAREDLDSWSRRQEWLHNLGYYAAAIDGVAGPKTTAALKALGFPAGIFARWTELAELPPMPPGWTRP